MGGRCDTALRGILVYLLLFWQKFNPRWLFGLLFKKKVLTTFSFKPLFNMDLSPGHLGVTKQV